MHERRPGRWLPPSPGERPRDEGRRRRSLTRTQIGVPSSRRAADGALTHHRVRAPAGACTIVDLVRAAWRRDVEDTMKWIRSFLLALLAILGGSLVGIGAALWLQRVGIDFSALLPDGLEWAGITIEARYQATLTAGCVNMRIANMGIGEGKFAIVGKGDQRDLVL